MSMIWTRRSFLQTVLATVGTVAVAPAIKLGEAIAAPVVAPPIFDPTKPYNVYELIALPVHGEIDTPVTLRLTRQGQSVPMLVAAMRPWSIFRWCAIPGGELVDGTTIINESDDDLDVQFGVEQRGAHWWIMDGQAYPR